MTKSQKTKPAAPAEPYKPTKQEAGLVADFDRRSKNQRPLALVKVTTDARGTAVGRDHPDNEVWAIRLCNAIGTTYPEFADLLANQAVNACLRGGANAKPDERTANGILAAVAGIAPRDEAEAMLALQMAATHNAAMEMLKRAMLDQTTEVAESIVNRATKLLRTYAAQVDALTRYRNAGKQQVIVQHQHVGVVADKAVVGVGVPGMAGGGVSVEMERQAHAQAITYAPSTPMPSADAARELVPVASDAERPL